MLIDKPTYYDVVIVGAGMVGTATACALANSTLKIAIIETHQSDFNWPENSHDIRVSALTQASQTILQNLGVWSDIVSDGACAYTNMSVWDATGQGAIQFDSVDVGQINLGHIVENRIIQKALQVKLAEFDNIDLLMPVQLQSMKTQQSSESGLSQMELLTEDGQLITTKLLIGADGANSWVRQQAGIALDTWAYQQTAIVCNVKTSESHQNTCWQQFMPEGPLAFLPLFDGQSSIVWSTTADKAEQLLTMDETLFNQELQMTFGSGLGRIELSSIRGAFSLQLRHVKQYVQPHLALIGDAAHTVHPLAGQGVNLGFLDAVVLAEEILKAHKQYRDIGRLSTLRRFERRRKGDNIAMLAAMDGFKRLFSNDILVLKLLRNTGLSWVNKIAPAKQLIIKQAMGLSNSKGFEPLPQLARVRFD